MSKAGQRLAQMVTARRATGPRITPQRLTVLTILAASQEHPQVGSTTEQLKEGFPTTSLATGNRTSTKPKELGQVRERGWPRAAALP
ncbi:MAG: transcriptional repressor [Deltaproteobacteria bacterium]|nr:transcriptional repressor [Deltaproteobacteria bacterium]